MNPLEDPSYLLPPLLAGAASVGLFLLVARRALWSESHRYFGLFLLALGLSSFLIYMMRSSPAPRQAVVWENMLVPVMMLSALAYYQFTAAYTGVKQKRLFRPGAVLFVVAVVVAGATGSIAKDMQIQSYGYAPVWTLWFYPLALGTYMWIVLGMVNALRAYRASRVYEERNRLLYIAVGTSLPVLGSMLDILPSTYPTGILGNLGFAGITIFAMRRYHLLDIGLVLQKGLVYVIVSTVVAVPYVTIMLLGTRLSQGVSIQPALVFLVLVLLALGVQPLWNLVQGRVDKVFFRRRWDMFHILEEFTSRSRSMAELERPVYELVEIIPTVVQVDGVALLLPSNAGVYVPAARAGKESLSQVRLSNKSPLVTWLEREQRSLERRDLDVVPQLQVMASKEKQLLDAAGAHLFVPLHLRERLIGLLVLGAKLAESPYTRDERRFLTMVSTQAAVLLDDTRLYQETKSQLEQGRQRMEAFQTAARKLTLEEDPRQALQTLVNTARTLVEARSVAMQVWSPAGRLEHSITSGRPLGSDLGSRVAALFQSMTQEAPRRLNGAPSFAASQEAMAPAKRIIMAEIHQRDGSRGMLAAGGKERAPEFSGDDERLLNLFAALAEVVLENVKLYGTVVQERGTLAAIQSSMAEGLIVLDANSHVMYLNQVAAAFLGRSEHESVGKPITDVLGSWSPNEKDVKALKEFMEAITSPTERCVQTVEIALTQPAPQELALTSFPIPGGPQVSMTGFLLRDITREREQERRRDAFVSMASHQLRTPMAVINGFAELLLQRDLPEDIRRDSLGRIYRNSQLVVALVNDLLNLTRIQTGQLSVDFEQVPIGEVVQEAVSGLESNLENHRLVIEEMGDLPAVVADREKLVQILNNLLENAVKYSPEGGRVTVSAHHDEGQTRVVLAVRDNGMGIAPEDQAHLFTLFHRIQRPETMDIKGTGLGLYIVKRLTEMMNGNIWVESEVGKGSTFYVSLPTVYVNAERGVEAS